MWCCFILITYPTSVQVCAWTGTSLSGSWPARHTADISGLLSPAVLLSLEQEQHLAQGTLNKEQGSQNMEQSVGWLTTTLQTFRQKLKPYLFECYEKHLTIFNLNWLLLLLLNCNFFVVRITQTKTYLASKFYKLLLHHFTTESAYWPWLRNLLSEQLTLRCSFKFLLRETTQQ